MKPSPRPRLWGAALQNTQRTHCRNGHEYTPEDVAAIVSGRAAADDVPAVELHRPIWSQP